MKTFFRHAVIWLGVFVVYTYMMSYYGDYWYKFRINLVNIPLFIAAYYTLKHVQLPYLYNRGKMGLFILSLVATSFLFTVICRIAGVLWLDKIAGVNPDFLTLGNYFFKTIQYYTPAIGILAWQSIHDRRLKEEKLQKLENEKLSTELKFLKAQLNPHFLFNTLNNLYSYVLNQSPEAPDMILKLSGILDYVLYKSQNDTVALKEEVESINNFIGLEKIRYGDRLKVECSTAGNLSAPISPLILLSLVENAFKHGASGDVQSPHIKINITEDNSTITCHIWNTKSKINGEINDAYKEGIGLSNVRRQLNLIYPDRHRLDLDDQPHSFDVSLSLYPSRQN